ncbi:unnamed protein product [Caenorhabditis sp. 36 PRJEB53466]|nr:unnamed protein product [Caenorhabditis sp. 36 PRJEB53466]
MFESSATTATSSNNPSNSVASVNYFDLGSSSLPQHSTSVIVSPRPHPQQHHRDENPLTPNCYYPGGYGLNFFLGATDLLQFQPSDVTSPLTPNINSPLTPSSFCGFPGLPANQLYNRPFPDFYAASSSTPMVQYSTVKRPSTGGRKPKEEDNMEEDDDDKRQKRRQRNKEAAARCRQRRLDLMKELQDQVNGYKNLNDKKTQECIEIRNKLASLKNYLEHHDCKLSHDERIRHLSMMTIPAPAQMPLLHHQLRVHPPRADSVAHSVMSNHSSSSSEQHSPIEDYKPSIDQLLPPISTMVANKDRQHNLMPPPALPSTSGISHSIITSIPVPHSNNSHRSENVFAEPELKIPKIDMDRTLTALASVEDLERPSMLPMLSRNPVNHPITTPSRIFRYNGEHYQNQTPQPQQQPPTSGSGTSGSGSSSGSGGLFSNVAGDFLATNTGLTPSGQPTMNFVSTPTPIMPHPDADLRPL